MKSSIIAESFEEKLIDLDNGISIKYWLLRHRGDSIVTSNSRSLYTIYITKQIAIDSTTQTVIKHGSDCLFNWYN